jgi:hypothetical protein
MVDSEDYKTKILSGSPPHEIGLGDIIQEFFLN